MNGAQSHSIDVHSTVVHAYAGKSIIVNQRESRDGGRKGKVRIGFEFLPLRYHHELSEKPVKPVKSVTCPRKIRRGRCGAPQTRGRFLYGSEEMKVGKRDCLEGKERKRASARRRNENGNWECASCAYVVQDRDHIG